MLVSTSPWKFTEVASGELPGNASGATMPVIACAMVRFRADGSNSGKIAIGAAPGPVTLPDGNQDTSTGLVLGAGADSDWIFVDRLDRLAYITTGAGDKMTYLILR